MAASPSPLPALLPDPLLLRLDEVVHQIGVTVLKVSVVGGVAQCPACGTPSAHVHSSYSRTLRDLPWHGTLVRLHLRSHRFYCRVQGCDCGIFTQRLPSIVTPYARQTNRHREAILAIGYALGGAAGCRLASELGIHSSGDTILRLLRQSKAVPAAEVKVLGIDDWAWRRGHRYGTVLIDLERHQTIDLLPDREADTLADWLRAHPSVQIVSRDRAGAYADGTRRGAPSAVQVADRFHLFCNLTSALQRVLERLTRILLAVPPPPEAQAAGGSEGGTVSDLAAKAAESQQADTLNQHHQRRDKRKALFDAVLAAYQQGLTKRAIAKKLGLTRTTVRRYLRAKDFPERAPRQRKSSLDRYRDYLQKRWADGCHNASQLCRELRSQGYGGQRSRVKEYVQPWRAEATPKPAKSPRTLPNLKVVAFWLAKPPDRRTAEEQAWVTALTTENSEVAAIETLAQQFRQVFKDRKADSLRNWVSEVMRTGIPELAGFVNGVERDYDAVEAAVVQPWSNGQVEGQVHRIKLLKRQMYGRSGFTLLRRRVLPLRSLAPQSPP